MSSGDGRRSLWSALVSVLRDRRGASAAMFAIALPVLAGMAALAIDAGTWMVEKRQAQGAADQAAYSAALAGQAGANSTQWTTEARAVAANMGFVDGVGGVTVAVTKPAPGYTGDYWEVIVAQPQMGGLSRIFLATAPTARARAVAGLANGGNACVVGLNATANDTVRIANNANFSTAGCAIYSNSSSASALNCNNNCTIAASTYVVGGVATQPNSHLNGTTNQTGAAPAVDPYASVSLAGYPSTCTGATATATGGTINPGRYCGGINVPNGGSLTLTAGTYWIDQRFTMGNSAATLNATSGVTIIIRPNPAAEYQMAIGNNAILNITAQSTGPFAGIAIMGLSNNGANAPNFGNGIQFHILGALYFPNQLLNMDNNAIFDPALCTQLVADRVQLSNNVNMNNNCPGSGIRNFGAGIVQLIE